MTARRTRRPKSANQDRRLVRHHDVFGRTGKPCPCAACHLERTLAVLNIETRRKR